MILGRRVDRDATARMKLFAISGSLRAGSSATALARRSRPSRPRARRSRSTTSSKAFRRSIPIATARATSRRRRWQRLRAALTAADAVVISTPEYAFGVPGVLKNALDWTVASGDFAGKPTAAISSSPSDLGGDKAYASLLLTLGAMQARLPTNGGLVVPLVRKKLDAGDDATRARGVARVRSRPADNASCDSALLRELARHAARETCSLADGSAPSTLPQRLSSIPPSRLQMPEPLALMKRKTKQ